MKRIPFYAGLSLAVILIIVTMLVRVTDATNDPCYTSCSAGANQRISDMSNACYSAAAPHTPTFNSHCTDATESGPGGYSYSCSWGGVTIPPGCYMPSCAQGYGGGFGGGNKIDPNDAACLSQ